MADAYEYIRGRKVRRTGMRKIVMFSNTIEKRVIVFTISKISTKEFSVCVKIKRKNQSDEKSAAARRSGFRLHVRR